MTYLPKKDHVVRHIKSTHLIRDDDDRVIGCFPEAFQLRAAESSLSVSWLEFYDGTREERIGHVMMNQDREIRARDGLGVGNVGEIEEVCAEFETRPRFIHEPTEKNPAHSAIRQIPRDNTELLARIAYLFSREIALAARLPRSSRQ